MAGETINSEYISINIVSKKKYLPLSPSRLTQMCNEGIFKTAFKPGSGGRGSKWLILKSEVLAHRFNGHANPTRK